MNITYEDIRLESNSIESNSRALQGLKYLKLSKSHSFRILKPYNAIELLSSLIFNSRLIVSTMVKTS